MVHRDLKPANVLLSNDPTVAKISDFGISRIEEANTDPLGATDVAVTGTGVVLGTPVYMPPEAARGGRNVDARGDAFAFGIIAYELITGRAPFKVPPVLLAMTGQTAPLPAMDGIDKGIAATIEECLTTDPSMRPTMSQIIAHLGG